MRKAILAAIAFVLGCPKQDPPESTPHPEKSTRDRLPSPSGCAPLDARIDGTALDFPHALAAVDAEHDTLIIIASSEESMTCDDVRNAKSHDYPYEFSEATGPQYAWEVLRFEYDLAEKDFSKLRWRSGWNSLSSSDASIQRRDSAPELLEVCIGSPTTIKSRRSYTRTVLRESGEKDVSTEWFESLIELEGGIVARECPRQG